MSRRSLRALLATLDPRRPKWQGPVVRRDPASYRGASEVPTKCRNPHCREYLVAGSREAGRCLVCNVSLTAD